MIDLSGTHLAVPTPFDAATEDVDLTGFRLNLEAWFAEPIAGVLVGGSTGESVSLEPSERASLVRAARAVAGTEGLIIGGAAGESTRAAAAAVESVARAGAHAALVSPPAFYRGAMTPTVLVDHYTRVAEASPVPLLIYQVPLRLSTIELPVAVVAEIAALPNVVGIKDSRGDLAKVLELISACPDDFQVLVGSGGILLDALRFGAVGGIVAAGAISPGAAAAVSNAFLAGSTGDAERAQSSIAPLHDEVVGGMGVPGIKAALDLTGLVGGNPRRPLVPLARGRRDELRAILERAGMLDSGVGAGA